jgi:hypothetical protein
MHADKLHLHRKKLMFDVATSRPVRPITKAYVKARARMWLRKNRGWLAAALGVAGLAAIGLTRQRLAHRGLRDAIGA